MSSSHFFLLVITVYFFYYIVNILIDLAQSKSGNLTDNEASVQYDFGIDTAAPKDAIRELKDNSHQGDINHSMQYSQETIEEDANDVRHKNTAVDTSLENHSNTTERHLKTGNKKVI